MSKFTSFHLRSGQLFYAKTGAPVPEKMIGRMEVRGKTVYRDGRKVGSLKQKTITKKVKSRINKNIKPGSSRVKIKRPRSRGPKGGVGGVGGPGLTTNQLLTLRTLLSISST